MSDVGPDPLQDPGASATDLAEAPDVGRGGQDVLPALQGAAGVQRGTPMRVKGPRKPPNAKYGLSDFLQESYEGIKRTAEPLSRDLSMFCKTCGRTQPCKRGEPVKATRVAATLAKKAGGSGADFIVAPWVCGVCGNDPTAAPVRR